MTTPHARHEIEGMQEVPNGGEPWGTRLQPPHPPQVARAAGALVTETRNRAQAYRVAYTLHDAGLLAPDPANAEEQWCVFHGGDDPDNCAGWEERTDETDAEEHVQWMIDAGVAIRCVTYGPWRVTMRTSDIGPDAARWAPGTTVEPS